MGTPNQTSPSFPVSSTAVRRDRRTRIGIDTFNLLLDLVVEPDLTGHVWKDEDEYAQARRLGVIDDALHRHIDEARQQVVAQIGSREDHSPTTGRLGGAIRSGRFPNSPLMP
jgi:hypothetical protein